MATINVVDDHGAVGDGSTDDQSSIQNALDAASNGDTVFIPETNDYYLIDAGSSGSGAALTIESMADDVTIEGGGKNAKLVVKANDSNSSNIACLGTSDGTSTINWSSITIKKLVLDGGWDLYQNLRTKPFQWFVSGDITGKTVNFEDVIFQWASYDESSTEGITNSRGSSGYSGAGSDSVSYITFTNCTAKENGQHGFNPDATGEGTANDPEVKFINCKAVDNGDQSTTGTPLDLNGGNVEVDGFYADNHQYALKAGTTLDNIDYFQLKDVHVRNTNNKGIKTNLPSAAEGNHTYTMDWNNVYVYGSAQEGVELRGDYTLNVSNSVMLENCNTDGDSEPDDFFQIIEDGTLNAGSATFIAQNANGSDADIEGITYGASGSGSLDQYYYFNIPTAVDQNGNLSISNQTNSEQSKLDVPSSSEVGAFVSGTTLNVQDYGAVGDGSTDDTAAIQQAIDDTNAGDTVYIPSTNAYYKVTSSGRAAVQVQTAADNVTIEGDGKNSVIKLGDTDDTKNQAAFGAEGDGPTMTGILVQDLVFSGNKSVNSNDSAKAVTHYPNGTGHDLTYKNVICENSAGTGFSNRGVSKMTLENVTSRNNTRHGFDFTADEDSNNTYDMDAYSIRSVNNGGTGLDFHRGKHRCEKFYVGSDSSGNKIGSSGGTPKSVLLKNGQIVDSGGSAWRSTATGNSDVTFDKIQILNPTNSGFYLVDDHNYTMQNQILVENANTDNSSSRGVWHAGDASLDCNTDLRIQQTQDNAGYFFSTDSSSADATIDHYYHANNDGGATNTFNASGTLTISNQTNSSSSYLSVPDKSDVGAFSSSSTTSQTEKLDFNSYTVGDTPGDWTAEWSANASDYTVESDSLFPYSPALQYSSSNNYRQAFSYDIIGEANDFDIVALTYFVDSNSASQHCRLYVRGGGSDGSETGYFVTFQDVEGGRNIVLDRYLSAEQDTLASTSADSENKGLRWVRFRAWGSDLKVRTWKYGDEEPSTWDIDVTDSELTNGWCGVGSYTGDQSNWDWFGVSTAQNTVSPPTLSVEVDTLDALNTDSSSSDLKGEVLSMDSDGLRSFFQYREEGNSTWNDMSGGEIYVTVPNEYTLNLSGLNSNTTYEYRAVGNKYNVNVSTNQPPSVGSSTVTLEGDLTKLDGPSDVDVYFEWRKTSESNFNETTKDTVSTTGTFTKDIGVSSGNEYEYRAVFDSTTSPESFSETGSLVTFST